MSLRSEFPSEPDSPSWGSTTKLIVGLTLVAIIAALVIQFRGIVGPLLLAFILAYLMHPVIVRFSDSARLPWRTSVNLVYLLLVVFLVGLFTLTGLAIVQQIQNIIGFVQQFLTDLPTLITDLSNRVYVFGPFQFNVGQFNLPTLTNQLLPAAQTVLDRLGSLISTFATSALVTLGWGSFVLLISYFLLADAGRYPSQIVRIEVPGYSEDIRRLGAQLSLVWNAFLRGQFIIFLLVMISYTVLMSLLGIRYALGIALLAGLARFVPYAGPFVTWTVTALVAFFQGGNLFHIEPLKYAILVVGCALLLDQIFDNLISPRILGRTLGVHPAAVLVVAIMAANLIGIVGLVLAAPVLASIKLLGRYILRKLFDLDPWVESGQPLQVVELPWVRGVHRLRAWMRLRVRPGRPKED